MKKLEKTGYVAVIDPTQQFLCLEDALQAALAPNPVVGFDRPETLLEMIPSMKERYGSLQVVADSAAWLPSVEEGIFRQTRRVWPSCRGIAFTRSPSNSQWKKIGIEEEAIVFRGDPHAEVSLLKALRRGMSDVGGLAISAEQPTPPEDVLYRRVDSRVELIDFVPALLERLRLNPDEIYRINASQFEELVCERLRAMGFEAQQTGPTNHKDGGIDIVFYSRGPFPILAAAQVKHHRGRGCSNGPDVIRDFRGVLAAHPFQFGVVVTNTTFTRDAFWFADRQHGLIRLRDGEDLRRWIDDRFVGDELRQMVPITIELCPGLRISVPAFR